MRSVRWWTGIVVTREANRSPVAAIKVRDRGIPSRANAMQNNLPETVAGAMFP